MSAVDDQRGLPAGVEGEDPGGRGCGCSPFALGEPLPPHFLVVAEEGSDLFRGRQAATAGAVASHPASMRRAGSGRSRRYACHTVLMLTNSRIPTPASSRP